MAKKKAKSGVNKSQEIRSYRKTHPNHKPKQISEELGKQGIDVSAQFVSTVLSTSKKKKRVGKPGRPRLKAASRRGRPAGRPKGASNNKISVDSLIQVKQVVKEMGGIAEVRSALNALEKLMS